MTISISSEAQKHGLTNGQSELLSNCSVFFKNPGRKKRRMTYKLFERLKKVILFN